MTIADRVRMLMADVLDIPMERLDADNDRDSLPEWDSLAHLRLMTALEEEFGVRLSMAEINDVHSLSDVIGLAERV